MKKLLLKFLIMNTLATAVLALGVVKLRNMTGIVILMVLYFGYLVFAAFLFRKQSAKVKSRNLDLKD